MPNSISLSQNLACLAHTVFNQFLLGVLTIIKKEKEVQIIELSTLSYFVPEAGLELSLERKA